MEWVHYPKDPLSSDIHIGAVRFSTERSLRHKKTGTDSSKEARSLRVYECNYFIILKSLCQCLFGGKIIYFCIFQAFLRQKWLSSPFLQRLCIFRTIILHFSFRASMHKRLNIHLFFHKPYVQQELGHPSKGLPEYILCYTVDHCSSIEREDGYVTAQPRPFALFHPCKNERSILRLLIPDGRRSQQSLLGGGKAALVAGV